MTLPIRIPYLPMEALSVSEIPEGEDWQYEPKWDGFRCLAFRDGKKVRLQSKAGQPLERYFPELVTQFAELEPEKFVLDGEIVLPVDGDLSFDDLLMRIHPAKSRIAKLAAETRRRSSRSTFLLTIATNFLRTSHCAIAARSSSNSRNTIWVAVA